MIGYDDYQVKRAVTLKRGVSLNCLRRVLEVLESERKNERMRENLLKEELRRQQKEMEE